MKSFLHAGKFLALDMASTFFFLALFALTHDVTLSVALGMALGVGQILWQRASRRPIDLMQWMSLGLVLVSGTITLVTHDARFVMVKPTLIYIVVGCVMLKKGWMNRYLPPVAMEVVPDLGEAFGYVWAAMMFASAALNLVLALNLDPLKWAAVMSLWATGSKASLFVIQFAVMRWVGGQRRRSGLAAA
jgi:intracellular septation protein A